jgi:hypothetical protein
MKKIVNIFLLSTILFATISCGTSEEEKAKIEMAAKEELKKEMEEKAALQNAISTKSKELTDARNLLIETKAMLDAEIDKMSSIKQFQLGRTSEEREQQIIQQSELIQKLEENVGTLQSNIPIIENELNDLKLKLQQ